MPALVLGPPSSWEALDNAIAHLSDFDWLILTSSNGIDYCFERLLTQGKDARALAGVKIAVVGKKTAASLKERGLVPDFIPPDFVADSLVEHFPEPLEGKKVLFPRVETGGREVLLQELAAKGAEVTEVAAYQSGCPAQMAPAALDALQKQAVDVITFASSKTVKHFCQLLESSLPGDSAQFPTPASRLQSVCIASIGPQTSITCRQLLGRVDVEAEEYTLEGLTQAIVQWMSSLTQRLVDDLPTLRTVLRSVVRWNSNCYYPKHLAQVFQPISESRPCSIRNRLRQSLVFDHVMHLQVLIGNQVVRLEYAPCQLHGIALYAAYLP
jgi:uroporphyrinogen-III synthase